MRRTPTRPTLWLLATLLALGACGTGTEPVRDTGTIEVTDATTPVPAASGLAVIYLTIRNSGRQDDALVGASSPTGAEVTLHRTMIDAAGSASMSSVEDVPVPAEAVTELSPGRDHLMVVGGEPLKLGDRYRITLEFRKAGAMGVEVLVVAPGSVG